MLESSGGSRRDGLYSAGQPKASPVQAWPLAYRLAGKLLTSSGSGIMTGTVEVNRIRLWLGPAAVGTELEIVVVAGATALAEGHGHFLQKLVVN